MARDDEVTQHGEPEAPTSALARAIQEVIGKTARDSGQAASTEAAAVMHKIPDAVRRHLDDVLARHGVKQIPDELRQIAERFDAAAERVVQVFAQTSEGDRTHLEKTLDRAISELAQELSRAVLSLTQSSATMNQRVVQLELAMGERIALIIERMEKLEKAIEYGFAATAHRLASIEERASAISKRMEALETRSVAVISVEPRIGAIERKLEASSSAARAVQRQVESAAALMQSVDDKISAAPDVIRALEEKVEALVHRQRDLAGSTFGRREQLLAFGVVVGSIVAAAALTVLALR